MNRYVPGMGPTGAKLAIVGEAPSYEEESAGKPFVGSSGRELDRLCKDAGINRADCWITNVSKFMVPANESTGRKIPFQVRAKQAGIDLNQQLNELRTELQQINPNCILGLGGTALWALTGKQKITDYRGSILYGMGGKSVSTYHPAHLLHTAGEIKGYWNRQVMIFDFKRAKYQSTFPEVRLPRRLLSIVQNSGQFYDFIQRYKNHTRPAIDIEAVNCIPSCIGISYTPNEGITVPLWNHGDISSIPDSDLASCWILLSQLLINSDVVGQNFGYDRDKIKKLGFIIRSLASDTMLKSFVINPELPKNLAFNTSIYTEEPFYKNEGMYEGSQKDLQLGCARDACCTKEVDIGQDADIDELGMRPFYEKFILPLHDVYAHIESNGFRINHAKRESILRKYVEWSEKLNYELFQLAGAAINTSSPKQVASLLYDTWKIPTRQGTGEEVLTQLLNNTVKKPEYRRGIEIILEDRRVKKTISTYVLAAPDLDDRMRTSYFICLETGRTSTQQQEPPVRPLVNYTGKKKNEKPVGLAFQTITKHGDIGPEYREIFIPDDGEIFLQADSAQAEARVVFLLANDEQALKDIDVRDYHALTASWFFGGEEKDYSKKVLGYESPYRFAGKTLRHAGHLGASKRRAAIEVNTQARKFKIDFQLSEKRADDALKIFHKMQPSIQQVFHKSIVSALEKTRNLIAPIPQSVYDMGVRKGGQRTFFERWGEDLFRQAFSYIPQRAVSDNTKAAALQIYRNHKWIRILGEAHDALLVSVPVHLVEEAGYILKYEMERPIIFENCSVKRRELIIPCELEIGEDYKNLSKFKFMKKVA